MGSKFEMSRSELQNCEFELNLKIATECLACSPGRIEVEKTLSFDQIKVACFIQGGRKCYSGLVW